MRRSSALVTVLSYDGHALCQISLTLCGSGGRMTARSSSWVLPRRPPRTEFCVALAYMEKLAVQCRANLTHTPNFNWPWTAVGPNAEIDATVAVCSSRSSQICETKTERESYGLSLRAARCSRKKSWKPVPAPRPALRKSGSLTAGTQVLAILGPHARIAESPWLHPAQSSACIATRTGTETDTARKGVAADELVARPSASRWRSQLNAGTFGRRQVPREQ